MYPIKKRQRGHYVLYRISLEPQSVAPMEKAFKINPNILKYLLVKQEA